jgi:hypothetical protein
VAEIENPFSILQSTEETPSASCISAAQAVYIPPYRQSNYKFTLRTQAPSMNTEQFDGFAYTTVADSDATNLSFPPNTTDPTSTAYNYPLLANPKDSNSDLQRLFTRSRSPSPPATVDHITLGFPTTNATTVAASETTSSTTDEMALFFALSPPTKARVVLPGSDHKDSSPLISVSLSPKVMSGALESLDAPDSVSCKPLPPTSPELFRKLLCGRDLPDEDVAGLEQALLPMSSELLRRMGCGKDIPDTDIERPEKQLKLIDEGLFKFVVCGKDVPDLDFALPDSIAQVEEGNERWILSTCKPAVPVSVFAQHYHPSPSGLGGGNIKFNGDVDRAFESGISRALKGLEFSTSAARGEGIKGEELELEGVDVCYSPRSYCSNNEPDPRLWAGNGRVQPVINDVDGDDDVDPSDRQKDGQEELGSEKRDNTIPEMPYREAFCGCSGLASRPRRDSKGDAEGKTVFWEHDALDERGRRRDVEVKTETGLAEEGAEDKDTAIGGDDVDVVGEWEGGDEGFWV